MAMQSDKTCIIDSLRKHLQDFCSSNGVRDYNFEYMPAIRVCWIRADTLQENYKDIRIADTGLVEFFFKGRIASVSSLGDPNCIKYIESFILKGSIE